MGFPQPVAPVGTASGDLAGTYPSPTVAAVTGSAGAVTLPATVTLGDGSLVLGSVGGTKVGTAITQKLGFYNTAPIAQRAGAAQAAVVTTGSTAVTPFGYTTAAQADAIVTLVNELRATLVALGLIKGGA